MGLVKVTPKKDVIHAIEFTGKNKEDVRKAVSEFATVREEENNAIALTRKGADIGKIMYPGQVLVITGTTTQVYSKARFEAEFEIEAKPKAPKKAAAAKEPGKVEAAAAKIAEEAKAAKLAEEAKAAAAKIAETEDKAVENVDAK